MELLAVCVTRGRVDTTSYNRLFLFHNTIKVDFANKKIGGGVLAGGRVQEEIHFCICPELIISRLIMDHMDPNEAIIITVSVCVCVCVCV